MTFAGTTAPNLPLTFVQQVSVDGFTLTPSQGEARIRLLADGRCWNGSAWTTAETWLPTLVRPASKDHTLTWTPPFDLLGSSIEVTLRINEDPQTQDRLLFLIAPLPNTHPVAKTSDGTPLKNL